MAPFSSIIKTCYSTDGATLQWAASNMHVYYHSGIDDLNLCVCVCRERGLQLVNCSVANFS